MNRLRLGIFGTLSFLFVATCFATEGEVSTQLPSFWGMLFGHEGILGHYIDIVYALLASILFSVLSIKVYRNRKLIPGKLQNFLEMCVEGMFNFLSTVLGNDAIKYTPFLGTLFFYIFINSLMGLIPGGHAPNTSLNVTASLAIMVFLYVQYIGFKKLGVKAYFDHLAGQPRSVASWVIAIILIIPIHIITEFAKPCTLAIRLWGNTKGGDILVMAFVGLGILILSFMHSPIGLPLQVPFILFEIFVSAIQALVFTLLSTTYILMMLPAEGGHH